MTDLLSVFQENIKALWATVFHLVGNEEDARDCLQQTYLDASQMDSSEVVVWKAVLIRIATRRAMDVLRKRYRRNEIQLQESEWTADAASQSSGVEFSELRELVRQLLAQLPVNQAQAFWLRHIEEYSNQEVSAALELSPENVRVLVHRATGYLRKNLDSDLAATLDQEAKQ